MVRRFPIAIWSVRFSELNSLLASALCHLVALVAMGLFVVAGQSTLPQLKLAVEMSEGADDPASHDAEFESTVEANTESVSRAFGPPRLFSETTIAGGDFEPVDALSELTAGDFGANGPALADFGDGAGGTKKGGKAATEFFGVSGYGERFVYVVDCSGSMSENGKFERAVYELLQSIEQLGRDQEYFIIFYNHRAFPMDGPGLVRATPTEFEKTRGWIARARPQGGTVPLPALVTALTMKPDAIFFLSDGLFDPATAREVYMRNRGRERQIPIHTIAFVNRENERLMQAIARNSGGNYRYVP